MKLQSSAVAAPPLDLSVRFRSILSLSFLSQGLRQTITTTTSESLPLSLFVPPCHTASLTLSSNNFAFDQRAREPFRSFLVPYLVFLQDFRLPLSCPALLFLTRSLSLSHTAFLFALQQLPPATLPAQDAGRVRIHSLSLSLSQRSPLHHTRRHTPSNSKACTGKERQKGTPRFAHVSACSRYFLSEVQHRRRMLDADDDDDDETERHARRREKSIVWFRFLRRKSSLLSFPSALSQSQEVIQEDDHMASDSDGDTRTVRHTVTVVQARVSRQEISRSQAARASPTWSQCVCPPGLSRRTLALLLIPLKGRENIAGG